MRNNPNVKIEQYRVQSGPHASTAEFGNNGHFLIPVGRSVAQVIASDMGGWEHASVSIPDGGGRVPTWSEMCIVKDLFWRDDETVIQYHPAKKSYVNENSVLHLWRPLEAVIPTPPTMMVGRLPPITEKPSFASMDPQELRACLELALEGVRSSFPFPTAAILTILDADKDPRYITNCLRDIAVAKLREVAATIEQAGEAVDSIFPKVDHAS